jgi:hypothetical protein
MNVVAFNRHRIVLPCAFVLALLSLTIYLPHLFGEGAKIGHDYSYFFPYLLSGHYWFLNNGFDIPWFTPALCGGIPHFPNPQSLYYSAPQLFLHLVDPLGSIVLTYYLFGALGFLGAYSLATLLFRQPLIAVFVGLAFMTNGFFLARTQVGHLSFHAFMLLPLVCYLLLAPAERSHGDLLSTDWQQRYLGQQTLFPTLLAGLCLAYFIHSGASVIVVPTGMCLVLVLWLVKPKSVVWVRLALAGFIALCLSANKLVAVAHFMNLFPRDFYQLPGYENFLATFYSILRGLTTPISGAESNALLLNRDFLFGAEEFDYRIGMSVLVAACSVFFWRSVFRKKWSYFWFLGVLSILILPIFLNTYHPVWQAALKDLPYFSTVSSLSRWNLIYMVSIILLSGWVWGKFYQRWGDITGLALLLSIAALIAAPLLSGYDKAPRTYDSSVITAAFSDVKGTSEVPVILHLEESLVNGLRLSVIGTGDALTRGASQVVCNEPVFGYRLEGFRLDPVFSGDVFAIQSGAYNFYRPDCLLFPAENQCVKGTRFSRNATDQLSRLVSWTPIDFQQPIAQKIAGVVTICSVWLVCIYLIYRGGWLLFRLFGG